MNAQAILEQIREDAKATAATAVAQAQEKAAEIRNASRQKIEAMRDEMVSVAEKESAELEQRLLRMAELDDRKELLGKKRELMDEAFSLALSKLTAMPAADKRAFFLQQVTAAAQGTQKLIIGANNADWFDAAFLEEANKALAETQKDATLGLSEERRNGCTGVILASEGAETHCTFETLLDAKRSDLETVIAAQLFGN